MRKLKGLIIHQMQPLDEIFMSPEEWDLEQWLDRLAASERVQAAVNALCEGITSAGISAADFASVFAGFSSQLNGEIDDR